MQPLGQYPNPSHTIAHVSDTHLLAGGKLQYGVVDTVEHLELALDRLARIDPVPQALVFTGDLADRGEPKAYQQLREMVEPLAERFGAQVIWCMGNHDDREAYARGLFDADATPDVLDRVYDVDGLRIVALDTSVAGYHHGEITDAQYDWLASCWPSRRRTAPSWRCTTRRSRSRCCPPPRSSSSTTSRGWPRPWPAPTYG